MKKFNLYYEGMVDNFLKQFDGDNERSPEFVAKQELKNKPIISSNPILNELYEKLKNELGHVWYWGNIRFNISKSALMEECKKTDDYRFILCPYKDEYVMITWNDFPTHRHILRRLEMLEHTKYSIEGYVGYKSNTDEYRFVIYQNQIPDAQRDAMIDYLSDKYPGFSI
jgi:hypothetical protein